MVEQSTAMKMILFSDIHCHEWPEFSSTDRETGLNSRLVEAVRVIRRIAKECVKRNIKRVVFGGDLFHVRGLVRVPVLQAVDAALRDLEAVAEVVYLTGNHDQADKEGIHAATSIFQHRYAGINNENRSKVINRYAVNRREETGYFAYYANPDKFRHDLREAYRKGARVLFVHAGIHGATTGPRDFIPREEIAPDEFKKFRIVFSGHYHKHQEIGKNIVYIGAVMQHYRSEIGYRTGFVVYDLGSKEFEHVRIRTPQFVRWNGDDSVMIEGNYVDATLPDGWSIERLRDHLSSAKALNIVLQGSTLSKVAKQRLNVDPATDPVVMLRRYAKRFRGELNLKKLIREGNAIVKPT